MKQLKNKLAQLIEPFSGQWVTLTPDKKIVLGVSRNMKKAISQANIGLMPIIDNNRIRLSLPPMTEDNRKDLVKILNTKIEESRISMRGVREKVKSSITDACSAKEITDDDKYDEIEKLEGVIKEYIGTLDVLGKQKEVEIMTI